MIGETVVGNIVTSSLYNVGDPVQLVKPLTGGASMLYAIPTRLKIETTQLQNRFCKASRMKEYPIQEPNTLIRPALAGLLLEIAFKPVLSVSFYAKKTKVRDTLLLFQIKILLRVVNYFLDLLFAYLGTVEGGESSFSSAVL